MLFHAFIVLLGSLLLAVGINCFFIPHQILDGGILGIALLAKYLFHFPTGLTMLICSTPIYMLAWFKDRILFYNSVHGLIVSSLLIDALYPFRHALSHFAPLHPVLNAIFGGLLIGTGVGLMLKYQTSTGGTDLLAKFIARWIPLNIGFLILLIDGIVILFGGLFLSKHSLLLSFIGLTAVGLATGILTAGEPFRSNKKS